MKSNKLFQFFLSSALVLGFMGTSAVASAASDVKTDIGLKNAGRTRGETTYHIPTESNECAVNVKLSKTDGFSVYSYYSYGHNGSGGSETSFEFFFGEAVVDTDKGLMAWSGVNGSAELTYDPATFKIIHFNVRRVGCKLP